MDVLLERDGPKVSSTDCWVWCGKGLVFMAYDEPYKMSFSIGGLCLRESLIVANAYATVNDWALARKLVLDENLLQSRMVSSSKRMLSEVIPRLKAFSEDELQAFLVAPDQDQRYLLWIAICRRHQFITDFCIEVLHDRYLSLKETVGIDEFNLFWSQQAINHPEVERISDLTKDKLRYVLFKMLQEVGLLTKTFRINTVVLSPSVKTLIKASDANAFHFFTTIDENGRRI
jgi:hypothetical protein